MAIAKETSSDLERKIGNFPFSGNEKGLLDALNSHVGDNVKTLVRLWLVKQGIPERDARVALPTSLVGAYTHRPYLTKWRNRVNPGFALLGGDEEDEGFDLTSEAKPIDKPDGKLSEATIKDLFEQINKSVAQQVNGIIANTTLKIDDTAKAQIRTLAQDAAKSTVAALMPPREINIINAERNTVVSLGLQHESFPKLLKVVSARDHSGHRLNIWLTGATGTGKSTAAVNVAKAIECDFGSDGSLDADYKVVGFCDANGNIKSTQFLKIYEFGGVYLADEIDNWLPSALLSLNAAMANGWCSTPKGLITRHADCCIIAAANTWGHGATNEYVGRAKQDAATIDRFVRMHWGIDERLERAIANADGELGLEWHDVVLKARKNVARQGLKIIISPRATYKGIALLKAGLDYDETVEMTITAGLSAEQITSLGLSNVIAPRSNVA